MCSALGQDAILDLVLYKFGIFIYLFILYKREKDVQMLLAKWHIYSLSKLRCFCSTGSDFQDTFKITNWRLAKVLEVAHMPLFCHMGSKLSLCLLKFLGNNF